MGLNEVPCIKYHLNSVRCPLPKCQTLYEFSLQKRQIRIQEFSWWFYHLGLQGDELHSSPSLPRVITSILFLLYKNTIVGFQKIGIVLK